MSMEANGPIVLNLNVVLLLRRCGLRGKLIASRN